MNKNRPTGKGIVVKGWYRWAIALGLVALGTLAGGLMGVISSSMQATAGPPTPGASNTAPPVDPSSDYARRVVARLYGSEEVTREELGEYLIARMGAERLENLVNRRIIEHACRERGIEVNAAEVDAALAEDCRGLGVSPSLFVEQVLKQYKKTLYEWKEDVLRPRLLMGKLCRDRIQVSDDDIHKAFETKYGEKVEVRIILDPNTTAQSERAFLQLYEKVRDSNEEFDRAARSQPIPYLAAKGGLLDQPVCKHAGEDEEAERVAFSLRPGELSHVMKTKDGLVMMKCVKHIPPDRTKIYENEHDALKKIVEEKKLQQEIGKVFEELKAKADPKLYLKKAESVADIKRDVRQELNLEPPIRPVSHSQGGK
jgi:hypothetical protein